MNAHHAMTPGRLVALLAVILALLVTGRPAAAQDATVEIDGGRVTTTSDVRVSADGDEAMATADGGSANTATLDARGRTATAEDVSLEVGNGGEASADASGGEVAVATVAVEPTTGGETLVPAAIDSGGNVGTTITAADTVASADGDASLTAVGADVVSATDLTVSADGGVALAMANGGDANTVTVEAIATGGAAILTDLTIGVGNGAGDSATADASGGTIALGEIRSGTNTGGVVAVGSTTSLGADARVVIHGGAVSSTTIVAITANGGNATATANGGSGNAVRLTAEARGGGLTSVTDTLAGSGTGIVTRPAGPACGESGTCIVGVAGDIRDGGVFPSGSFNGKFTADVAHITFPTPTSFAVPTSGRLTLTDPVTGDRLILETVGRITGRGGQENPPITYDATYTVIGGTGRFAGATGSGRLSIELPPNGGPGAVTAMIAGPLTIIDIAPASTSIVGATLIVGNGGDATALAGGGVVATGDIVTGGNVGPSLTVETT